MAPGIGTSWHRSMKPKRRLAEVLRDLAGFRNHWRYRQLGEQWRIFPAQMTRLMYGLPTIQLEELADPGIVVEPAILADLCLPNHARGPGHNDLMPLLQILRTRQPKVVMEFGTAHGNTTANVCRQCPQAQVFTVNALPEQISGEIITFAPTREEIGRVYRQHGFAERVVQIYANTLTVNLAEYVERQSVDLAIIDACHDTPFVIQDFLKVAPYIRPGGLVLLHDTHPSMEEHLLGSYRACMALRRQGYGIKHLRATWWGVWQAPEFSS
jgi:predicted O-methyltransferase YrrM